MNQFVYCITNPGNESYLKEEVRLKYADQLAFSFSKPGLCTFKNRGAPLTLQKVKQMEFAFSRGHGLALGLVKSSQVIETVEKELQTQSFRFHCQQLPLDPESDESLEFATKLKLLSTAEMNQAQAYIIVIKVAADMYFVGSQLKDIWNSPPGRIFYQINESAANAPSRAYHKTKEAFMLLGLPAQHKICIEFGCAPGGGSQFLLEQGMDVTGIDPAQMNPKVLDHPAFHFINLPIQDLKLGQLPAKASVMLSDVNLNPKMVLRICRNLFGTRAPELALVTIKISVPENLEQMHTWRKIFEEMGYEQIHFLQLVSHRRECLAIASKKKLLA